MKTPNTPTMDLIEEHGGIMLMLKIMEKVADKLRKGETVKKEHLEKILEFLTNFADRCHHGKEEDMLFPEMCKNLSNKKLINELLGEHKAARDYIRGVADSIGKYEPDSSDAVHMALNMEGYIQLLTEHITKENAVLFPIANNELSEARQEQMEGQFEKFEEEVIGVGKHEEYHGWLEELKKEYLG